MDFTEVHCNFANSTFAAMRMGISGSASFHSEKVLVCSFRFGGVAMHRVGSGDLEMGECSQRAVRYQSTMVEDFLEFGSQAVRDYTKALDLDRKTSCMEIAPRQSQV
jgi:hypothetical protein